MTMARPLRLAALAAAIALAACAPFSDAPRVASTGGGGALCSKVAETLLRGQRNSFGLNFREAENAFAALLSIYELEPVAESCPRAPSRAFLLMNQALAHSSQERFVTADGLFLRAAQLIDAAPEGDETAARDRTLLTAYRAQDQLNRSILDGARAFVEQAAARLEASGEAQLSLDLRDPALLQGSGTAQRGLIEEASNKLTLSHIRLLEGDLDGAEQAINEALDIIRLAPGSAAVYRPRFLSQRALIKLEQGAASEARADAAEAAEDFAALMPDTPLEARARLREGKALETLGQPDAALDAYARGFQVYEQNPVIVDYRSIWPFFRLALRLDAAEPERHDELAERVFRAAQIIRQSITAQTVAGAAALLGQGDGDKALAVRAWRDANERYANLKALQVLQLRDPLSQADQARELARAVADAQVEVARLRDVRDRVAPEYQSAIAAPVSLAAIQAALKPGEALVQVLAGSPRSFLIIVDRDAMSFQALPVTDSQIAVLVEILRAGVRVDGAGRVPDFRADLAHQTFNLLFPGLKDRLLSHDRLIFSTSGALQSLPLELLIVEPPGASWKDGDYSGLAWLGGRASLSYVPSPRNLVDIRGSAGSSRATRSVVSYGDFRDGVDPEKVLRISSLPPTCRRLAEAVDQVGPLPGTAAEAAAVAGIFGSDASVFTGAAFNEDAVKEASASGALRDFRVVHFATHGILWPTPDCFTDPALTVTATDGEDSDGLLTASEIRTMSLDAQLIVLSACNTASGYLVNASNSAFGARQTRGVTGAGGESLSGLARAFFGAGARAVLATHWPVADVETTDLMESFFRNLRGGEADFSTALRRAQDELRSKPRTSHPVFWAPFVVIGDAAQTL